MKNWISVLISIVLVSLVVAFYLSDRAKYAYVSNEYIFAEFKGKKELALELAGLKQKHQYLLDSMLLEINLLQERKDKMGRDSLAIKTQFYRGLLGEFEQIEQEEGQEMSKRIWTQINQYVADYGKQNGYDMIWGTSSGGTLMYGKETLDISNQVLDYINKRYEGGK